MAFVGAKPPHPSDSARRGFEDPPCPSACCTWSPLGDLECAT